jgi:hypothetical protein
MIKRLTRIDDWEIVVDHLTLDSGVPDDRLQDSDARMRQGSVDVAHRRNGQEDRHVTMLSMKSNQILAVVEPEAHPSANRIHESRVKANPGSGEKCVKRLSAAPGSHSI